MSRFMPSERLPRDEADAHYERIHHRFAMQMFREHAPGVRRYAINHATSRFDLNGTFQARPTSWRFVILEFEDVQAEGGGGKEWLPSWAESAIVDDHTNFLREVRPFEVEPRVLVDRRSGQTSLVKYLLEVEARGDDVAAAERARDAIRDAVVEAADAAFGIRLVIANAVVREAEMAAVIEPGQAYAGRFLDATGMTAIDELYFDHRVWGQEFFNAPAVRAALRPVPGVRIAVHEIQELVGVDRG
jgi:hypothetical protein